MAIRFLNLARSNRIFTSAPFPGTKTWGGMPTLLTGFFLISVAFHTVLPPLASAQQACPKGLLARVQADYDQLHGFRARFSQVDQRDSGESVSASGEMAYLRPGKMRWEYNPPDEQLLITDGKTVWLFDPLLENVTVHPLEGLAQGTPLAFLLGMGDLAADFICRATTRKPPEDALQYLELAPRKPVTGLSFVQLGIHKTTARLGVLRMFDGQGNIRTVRLETLKVTSTFEKDYFRFEIKPGMEVIRR